MNNKADGNTPEKSGPKGNALAEQRRAILSLPPEKAVEAILEQPLPVTLVQSMAEEDLYLLVQSVGPNDALEILGLASNQQWDYMLDMEIWSRDRIDAQAMTEWLERLLRADPDRFTHWIVNEQRDALHYYLAHNVELYIREYEQDPAEIAEEFSSEDQVHYLRMRPYASGEENSEQRQQQRDQFLGDLLRRLSVFDFQLYLDLLLESSVLVPAEVEEDLLRLRNVRMAEKGFLPFEEAIGIYQPLKLEELLRRAVKPDLPGGRPVESYPLRVGASELPEDANLFLRTLVRIQDETTLQRLQAEFAGLCNQIIAADQSTVRDKSALAVVVAKAGNYISIGLEKAEREAGGQTPYLGPTLLQNYLLGDIFRVGYGCALEVKWRADRWRHGSWFARCGLPLTFWGEAWLGVLGGLLIKKPLYYDNYANGVLYREFETLEDIERTGRVLDQIIGVDRLCSSLGVTVGAGESTGFLTWHNLLLTLWADARLGIKEHPLRPVPLAPGQFQPFFEQLWEPGARPPRIKESLREDFLNWLSRQSGVAAEEIAATIGPSLQRLFEMVEEELGEVDPRKIDARFVLLFLLAQ